DDVLRRNVERLNPHVDAVQCFYRPKNKIYAGALCFRYQSAEPQHDAALPLLDDVQRIPEPDEPQADDQRYSDKTNFHVFLLNVRIPILPRQQPHWPAQRTASVPRHAKSGRLRLPAQVSKIRRARVRHGRGPCLQRLRGAAQPRRPVTRSALPSPLRLSIGASATPNP